MIPERIFIVGFMGAGKSTVGRLLAQRLDYGFVDLDAAVESRAGKSVAQVFADDGEPAFRALEHEMLLEMGERSRVVVACGGGVVVDHANRAALRSSGTVVYLRVSAQEAIARIGDVSTRPLLCAPGGGELAATALLQARTALYSSVADVVVDTVGLDPDQVVSAVVEIMEGGTA